MSDGETGSKKKKSSMKKAWEAHALMKKYGFKTIEDMAAALEKVQDAEGLPEAPVTTSEAITVYPEAAVAPETVTTPGDRLKALVAPADDLAWITEDIGAVHVVARYQNLVLRPPRDNMNPPMAGVQVHEYTRGPWHAMPFDLRSRNREQEVLNNVHYGKWAHLAISRDVAESVYADERYPLPTKAVISAKEFGGWDRHANQARGTLRPLGKPVALREVTRRVLQRFVGEVFINATHHWRDMPDARVANPYGNRLAGLALKLPDVAQEGVTP